MATAPPSGRSSALESSLTLATTAAGGQSSDLHDASRYENLIARLAREMSDSPDPNEPSCYESPSFATTSPEGPLFDLADAPRREDQTGRPAREMSESADSDGMSWY